jgi:GntR family transcriptional repressor for pyruvate dehydrogenase complex
MWSGKLSAMSSVTGDLALTPVSRHKLGEAVARQLLDEIRDKRLAPGTRLPSERELTTALGVGRSTVREAIQGLAMLGVLDIRHGQGAFVADPSRADGQSRIAAGLARGVTQNLFEARRIVEVEAARLAAERRTDEELDGIAAVLADHEEAIAVGALGVEFAVAFHLRLAEASHNDVLVGFVATLSEVLEERGHTLEQIPGYREWELAQHRAVFAAVQAGDRQDAGRAMRRHLDEVVVYHEQIGSR